MLQSPARPQGVVLRPQVGLTPPDHGMIAPQLDGRNQSLSTTRRDDALIDDDDPPQRRKGRGIATTLRNSHAVIIAPLAAMRRSARYRHLRARLRWPRE